MAKWSFESGGILDRIYDFFMIFAQEKKTIFCVTVKFVK